MNVFRRPSLIALAVAAPHAHLPPQATRLPTVIVTAQRRAENIKDVPMSIATLKGDKLDVLTSGAADIRFLAGRSPSVNVESDYGRTFPRFYIRGLGNTDFDLNASQPVGLVMDDIVQENAMLKGFPVFDVDQVEVLRGPQGTLFGRNSPAGVIKFDSAKPVFKTEGYLQLGVGNYSAKTVEGVFNVPVSDTVALRFSGTSQHRDDRVHNTNPNRTPAPRTSKATATTPSACKPWYSRTRTSARCSTTTSATTTVRPRCSAPTSSRRAPTTWWTASTTAPTRPTASTTRSWKPRAATSA
jgi:outer membrane receptor protein involved in Fe transport